MQVGCRLVDQIGGLNRLLVGKHARQAHSMDVSLRNHSQEVQLVGGLAGVYSLRARVDSVVRHMLFHERRLSFDFALLAAFQHEPCHS